MHLHLILVDGVGKGDDGRHRAVGIGRGGRVDIFEKCRLVAVGMVDVEGGFKIVLHAMSEICLDALRQISIFRLPVEFPA